MVFPLISSICLVIKYLLDRKSTRLNSSHANISYAVFCLKKKKKHENPVADERGIPRFFIVTAVPFEREAPHLNVCASHMSRHGQSSSHAPAIATTERLDA